MKSDFDDPEASYRRGYAHGAYDVIKEISSALPVKQREILKKWLDDPVYKWRLKNLRGKDSNRGDSDLSALPPRHLLHQNKD